MLLRRSLPLALLSILALAPAASATSLVHVRTAALNVVLDPAGSDVTIWWDAATSRYLVHDPAGAQIDPVPGYVDGDCAELDATHVSCRRIAGDFGFNEVYVYGDDGDDTIRVGYGVPWHPEDGAAILGDGGDDRIGMTPHYDWVLAGEGDDLVDGAGGPDLIVGFNSSPGYLGYPGIPGNGYETGPGGQDRLYGGPGSDVLTDADVLADPGPDLLDGGVCEEASFCLDPAPEEAAGDADLVRYYRNAVVVIRLGVPSASGVPGEGDTIRNVEDAEGGVGDDLIVGDAGVNRLYGNRGRDTIRAGLGDDFIDGGDEALAGTGLGDLALEGGPGDDVIQGGYHNASMGPGTTADGADGIDGGPGEDEVTYEQRTTGVTVDLRASGPVNGQPGEGDRIANVEIATGSQAADTLFGNGAANLLQGLAGDDRLVGVGDPGVGDELLCGVGTDRAEVDADDATSDCETVTQPPAGAHKPKKRCKPHQLAHGRARCARAQVARAKR
jgi:hypothetical protein